MDQAWFEMRDVRRRWLKDAVWIPQQEVFTGASESLTQFVTYREHRLGPRRRQGGLARPSYLLLGSVRCCLGRIAQDSLTSTCNGAPSFTVTFGTAANAAEITIAPICITAVLVLPQRVERQGREAQRLSPEDRRCEPSVHCTS